MVEHRADDDDEVRERKLVDGEVGETGVIGDEAAAGEFGLEGL